MGLEPDFVDEAKADRIPNNVPYRTPLISLLRRCLSTKPKYRPSPLGLYRLTGDALESCYATVDGDFDRYRLYFRGNEINDMETGFHIPGGAPEDLYLIDEQFPVADTLDNEELRIRPPTVDEFYPYESDGREFFKSYAAGFQERHENKEPPQRYKDECGFNDFRPHRYNRMNLPKAWNPEYFDSSDDSDPDAYDRYKHKVKTKKPGTYQPVRSEHNIKSYTLDSEGNMLV